MFEIGDTVLVKENAYEGSNDPKDFEVRGKVGEIVTNLGDGCYEVKIGGEWYPLIEDEIERLDA